MTRMAEHTRSSVEADLLYLAEGWPALVRLKVPGSARSWVEQPRKHVLSESDLERMGKKGVPRQAPADVGVLDLLARIATVTHNVALSVAALGPGASTLRDAHERGEPWAWTDPEAYQFAARYFGRHFLTTRLPSVDPRPWLMTTRTWLGSANEADPQTVPWVGRMFEPIVEQFSRLLGDVRDGQCMNGVCPWCGGLVADGVVGVKTMRVLHPDVDDESSEPLIVCFGVRCSPPGEACGRLWEGKPAWGKREWEWLASQLVDLEELALEAVEDWASAGLRAAHRAYQHGVRTDVVCLGETDYQRLSKQRVRAKAEVS
ncbi:hypothetical protein CH298_13345 [Rhodococcoides fascians]|uniref:hypothetical protein n=1 Tax=Rhodococcoides fascians TaxID=1828 RepID=UPI000B9C3E37|nr:hypothetical protein [Rhodococcus fascians]OZE89964.1 hypothetical protein CH303_13225 [Rhodococcus fascians]OZF18271.1 hypothetical protein CH298_13345 [Rhodococcus fascians]OZF21722.1 hypothetical protein CH297_13240 [Rhodococcus fascians]OZF67347.1 hypothetical protein CH308_13140 [Rhodococcus fascians]OZF70536.1 hypothetical protein CH307_13335 [Rhodococcus fascians]